MARARGLHQLDEAADLVKALDPLIENESWDSRTDMYGDGTTRDSEGLVR